MDNICHDIVTNGTKYCEKVHQRICGRTAANHNTVRHIPQFIKCIACQNAPRYSSTVRRNPRRTKS
jgi:hypothetical protein